MVPLELLAPRSPQFGGGLLNDCLAVHADCFLHSLRGCLRVPDAAWQVYQETRSCRPCCISEGTGGAAPGQGSKPAFLSLGRTPGHLDVMGISSANVANSPPGRRARVCQVQTIPNPFSGVEGTWAEGQPHSPPRPAIVRAGFSATAHCQGSLG